MLNVRVQFSLDADLRREFKLVSFPLLLRMPIYDENCKQIGYTQIVPRIGETFDVQVSEIHFKENPPIEESFQVINVCYQKNNTLHIVLGRLV